MTRSHLLVCLIDDVNSYETPAVDYQPGDHGSVFLALDTESGLEFFQWKHGPMGSVETMRVIYANTYQVQRQLSIRLSDVCHFITVSPSDVTYRDLEDYASMALISEAMCNARSNWSMPESERLPLMDLAPVLEAV